MDIFINIELFQFQMNINTVLQLLIPGTEECLKLNETRCLSVALYVEHEGLLRSPQEWTQVVPHRYHSGN